ncbi:MAG: hypothetical protein K8W52_06330 [Deltaproteobacteria bacterium]|nr:hypothetical protein [Deltaproteobacteria bacterium]
MNEQFTVGEVLTVGFRVWGKNILSFGVITALIYLPLIVPLVVLTQGEMTVHRLHLINQIHQASPGALVLLNIIAGAALTYGVVMELQGQRASFGACVATGLKRFLPSLVVSLLVMLCVVLGILALVIPGMILSCMLAVATQASVIERPGLIGALKRSRTLTAGNRWGIFGLMMVESAIVSGTQLIVQNGLSKSLTVPAFIYLDLLRMVMAGSLTAVMSAVLYFYLRRDKEGTSAAELGQVFA